MLAARHYVMKPIMKQACKCTTISQPLSHNFSKVLKIFGTMVVVTWSDNFFNEVPH